MAGPPPDHEADRFGRRWPELDGHPEERCPVCGQPDNCGDCNHEPLTDDEARSLGGVPEYMDREDVPD